MQDGVDQLAFTFCFPEETTEEQKDEAEEIEAYGSEASHRAVPAGSESPRGTPRKRKWHSLIDKVYAPGNLRRAWARVQANAGAPGIDGITVEQFAERAEQWLAELAQDLRQKTYQPKSVRRVFIRKDEGGRRPLGIPTVRDRIVQQALLQILEPIFEPTFSKRSHGFRPGRGCPTALEVVDQAVRHGYEWVVDADLKAFFDTVDHERLLTALNTEVADGSVLKLIRRILTAGVSLTPVAEIEPTELGTPQGGPLSPLLANIYLHAFDEAMVKAGFGLVRYADDFVIFARTEREAEAALAQARAVLEEQLGLQLHPEKTRVVSVTQGFEFLGFRYFRDVKSGELRKEVRWKSVRRFRATARRHTPRLTNQRLPRKRRLTLFRLQRNQRVREIILGLNRFLCGWYGYFKHVWSPYETPFLWFDQFVRRRLRTSITGRTGSGWWHQCLTNALLHEGLGLISLDTLYQQDRKGFRRTPTRKGKPGGEPYAGKPHVRFGKAGGRATAP